MLLMRSRLLAVIVALLLAGGAVVALWLALSEEGGRGPRAVAAVATYGDEWRGNRVVVLYSDGTTSILDLIGPLPWLALSPDRTQLAAIRLQAPDGQQGATSSQFEDRPRLLVVDVSSGQRVLDIALDRPATFNPTMDWSPDGKMIAIGSSGGLDLITVETGSLTSIQKELGGLARSGGITWLPTSKEVIVLGGGMVGLFEASGPIAFGYSIEEGFFGKTELPTTDNPPRIIEANDLTSVRVGYRQDGSGDSDSCITLNLRTSALPAPPVPCHLPTLCYALNPFDVHEGDDGSTVPNHRLLDEGEVCAFASLIPKGSRYDLRIQVYQSDQLLRTEVLPEVREHRPDEPRVSFDGFAFDVWVGN